MDDLPNELFYDELYFLNERKENKNASDHLARVHSLLYWLMSVIKKLKKQINKNIYQSSSFLISGLLHLSF